ncbi:hypothetical protein EV127DRAFT_467807, partial [Xylaria flabelliformis]
MYIESRAVSYGQLQKSNAYVLVLEELPDDGADVPPLKRDTNLIPNDSTDVLLLNRAANMFSNGTANILILYWLTDVFMVAVISSSSIEALCLLLNGGIDML